MGCRPKAPVSCPPIRICFRGHGLETTVAPKQIDVYGAMLQSLFSNHASPPGSCIKGLVLHWSKVAAPPLLFSSLRQPIGYRCPRPRPDLFLRRAQKRHCLELPSSSGDAIGAQGFVCINTAGTLMIKSLFLSLRALDVGQLDFPPDAKH
ncbi:hypothetical protein TgHK011_005217 [Trichoderma gracile]|nr:hypothetical protein TgHK011_005217 [Trichoderma gracile]